MPRRILLLAVVIFAVSLLMLNGTARAQMEGAIDLQTPTVQIYFDEQLQVPHRDNCGAILTFDTLYVVASSFNAQIVDIEYLVDVSSWGAMWWIVDLIQPTYTATGESYAGIRVAFPSPVDATGAFLIQRIMVYWMCDCSGVELHYVMVLPHPISGKVQATRWPDMTKIEGQGLAGVICPVLPVEETTWGSIKALYQD
jgi:hypothetical protein